MSKLSILFLLTFVAGLVATLVINGAWGFYLYQLIYFLNPGYRWWSASIPAISYSFICVLFMMAAVVIKHKEYQKNKLFQAPQTKWLILILVMFYIVQTYAIVPTMHWVSTVELTKLFVVMAIAYKLLDNPKKLDLALWTFIIGASYIGWEAYNVGRNASGRVEGIGTVDSPDSNGIAAAMAPTIPLLIYFAWQGSIKLKLFSAFLGIWIVNGLVLINSRGSFLAVLAGAGYFILSMLFGRIQQKNQRIFAILIIGMAIGGALYLTDETFWNRMNTLTNVEDESASGSSRYRMWLATFDVIEDHPAGVGAYGFQALSPQYVDAYLFDVGKSSKAIHSTWFQSLAELGWPGPILLILLIISCFRTTYRIKKIAKANSDPKLLYKIIALECSLIAYLTAATFIDQLRAQILYWPILFIACMHNIHINQTSESTEHPIRPRRKRR